MVDPEPCKEVRWLPQLFLAGTVPYMYPWGSPSAQAATWCEVCSTELALAGASSNLLLSASKMPASTGNTTLPIAVGVK